MFMFLSVKFLIFYYDVLKMATEVAQLVQHLLSKHKTLSLISSSV